MSSIPSFRRQDCGFKANTRYTDFQANLSIQNTSALEFIWLTINRTASYKGWMSALFRVSFNTSISVGPLITWVPYHQIKNIWITHFFLSLFPGQYTTTVCIAFTSDRNVEMFLRYTGGCVGCVLTLHTSYKGLKQLWILVRR